MRGRRPACRRQGLVLTVTKLASSLSAAGHASPEPSPRFGLGTWLRRSSPFVRCKQQQNRSYSLRFWLFARTKGLEPSTSRVTGGCSNQLSYVRRRNEIRVPQVCKNYKSILHALRFLRLLMSTSSNLRLRRACFFRQL